MVPIGGGAGWPLPSYWQLLSFRNPTMGRAFLLAWLVIGALAGCRGTDDNVEVFTREMVAHALTLEARILEEGRPLDADELRLARAAGVAHPERVRILYLDEVPIPESPVAVEELRRMGVLQLMGLAAAAARGYGIIITPRGEGDRTVVAHELVHVAQYERFGGIDPMFRSYIPDLRANGYRRADLEDEAYARSAEIVQALPSP